MTKIDIAGIVYGVVKMTLGLLAQLVEQRSFKAWVTGPNPVQLSRCLLRLVVRTTGFHPVNAGSIPAGDAFRGYGLFFFSKKSSFSRRRRLSERKWLQFSFQTLYVSEVDERQCQSRGHPCNRGRKAYSVISEKSRQRICSYRAEYKLHHR